MALDKINQALVEEVKKLKAEGRAKSPERVIVDYIAPQGEKGPRFKLANSDKEFIRMNTNSYLDFSQHPELIEEADIASKKLGVGPGAVRFIDGTFEHHVKLEEKIAEFTNNEAAKIFNSAYTANLAQALTISSKETFWIGDELNHNSIIRAMRISNIPRENRSIYKHNDMNELRSCLDNVPEGIKRVCIIFDGIFSMRGDACPLTDIQKIADEYHDKFEQGVITIMDDSHGIGAYGKTGRGTEEYCNAKADIMVGTFGKAFGVNGGFIAGSKELIEAVRQKADTYIYTNPLSVADCAAALKSIELVDSLEGKNRLKNLSERIAQFRIGIEKLGIESIDGPHPVVPLVIRDTEKVHKIVQALYDAGILVVGLTFPVVPRRNETIRVQINAGLTEYDINYVLENLEKSL
jgi:glycine C-acetyltransferase